MYFQKKKLIFFKNNIDNNHEYQEKIEAATCQSMHEGMVLHVYILINFKFNFKLLFKKE